MIDDIITMIDPYNADEHNRESGEAQFDPMIPITDTQEPSVQGKPSMPVRSKLYTSHFLSTWNSRVFEFGAVLFLSTVFPGTLLPASVYALARAASVVVLSGPVGQFIDNGERMNVIRLSIGGYSIAFATSVLLKWYHFDCCRLT